MPIDITKTQSLTELPLGAAVLLPKMTKVYLEQASVITPPVPPGDPLDRRYVDSGGYVLTLEDTTARVVQKYTAYGVRGVALLDVIMPVRCLVLYTSMGGIYYGSEAPDFPRARQGEVITVHPTLRTGSSPYVGGLTYEFGFGLKAARERQSAFAWTLGITIAAVAGAVYLARRQPTSP